jgi:hypothetical protein
MGRKSKKYFLLVLVLIGFCSTFIDRNLSFPAGVLAATLAIWLACFTGKKIG